MGNACCRFSFSAQASVDVVGASCETVWEVRGDVGQFSTVTPHVLSAELLEPGDPQTHLGMKWREQRVYAGNTHRENTNTIIASSSASSDRPHHRSVTYSVCYTDNHWRTRNGNQTGTFQVSPLRENDPEYGCRMVMTVNFVAEDFSITGMWMKFCGRCVERYAVEYTMAELRDYARAAVVIQRERNKIKLLE